MRRAPALLALTLSLAQPACISLAHRSRASSSSTGLRLHGAPKDAFVTIDDQLVGPLDVVEARGVALPPGEHTISVEAPGYFPWDRVVDGNGAKRLELTVELRKIPE